MNYSRLDIGALMLLFVLPAAGAGELQAAQVRTGETGTGFPLPTGQRQESSFAADALAYRTRARDAYPGGLQLAAANPSARFEDECGQCHGDADEFVRESLMFENGALTGRSTEKPVVDFLKSHRGLKQADVDYYSDLLTRMAGEVGLE